MTFLPEQIGWFTYRYLGLGLYMFSCYNLTMTNSSAHSVYASDLNDNVKALIGMGYKKIEN